MEHSHPAFEIEAAEDITREKREFDDLYAVGPSPFRPIQRKVALQRRGGQLLGYTLFMLRLDGQGIPVHGGVLQARLRPTMALLKRSEFYYTSNFISYYLNCRQLVGIPLRPVAQRSTAAGSMSSKAPGAARLSWASLSPRSNTPAGRRNRCRSRKSWLGNDDCSRSWRPPGIARPD